MSMKRMVVLGVTIGLIGTLAGIYAAATVESTLGSVVSIVVAGVNGIATVKILENWFAYKSARNR